MSRNGSRKVKRRLFTSSLSGTRGKFSGFAAGNLLKYPWVGYIRANTTLDCICEQDEAFGFKVGSGSSVGVALGDALAR